MICPGRWKPQCTVGGWGHVPVSRRSSNHGAMRGVGRVFMCGMQGRSRRARGAVACYACVTVLGLAVERLVVVCRAVGDCCIASSGVTRSTFVIRVYVLTFGNPPRWDPPRDFCHSRSLGFTRAALRGPPRATAQSQTNDATVPPAHLRYTRQAHHHRVTTTASVRLAR